jgi:NAD(P)-dependent dehydrogenase (short-subunit alcohol dehydrogenase family)
MTDVLKGRIAVVTGAAKGLGAAIARELDSEGATVVVSDIDGPGAESVAKELSNGTSVTCDVRDEQQITEMLGWVDSRYGRLDVMVANAGIATVKPVAEMSLDEWRSVLEVNLDGVYSTVRLAANAMAGTGGGSIVTMASITGFAGSPLIGHYAAAKAGVISLTKTVATEMRDHGVRVNALCPGWIGTDLVHDRKQQFEEILGIDFDATINRAQGRLGTPEDVAPLAAFLASDRSRFSTGSAFIVDGGMSAALV